MHHSQCSQHTECTTDIAARCALQACINHPFLTQLVAVMVDDSPLGKVHLLLHTYMGGELFTLLQLAGSFDMPMTTFCSACVASAFVHLQGRRIVYRDLKPENLVFDSDGYVAEPRMVLTPPWGFSAHRSNRRIGGAAGTWWSSTLASPSSCSPAPRRTLCAARLNTSRPRS